MFLLYVDRGSCAIYITYLVNVAAEEDGDGVLDWLWHDHGLHAAVAVVLGDDVTPVDALLALPHRREALSHGNGVVSAYSVPTLAAAGPKNGTRSILFRIKKKSFSAGT